MRRLFVLMAVLYFCLVLLASSVLAQEGNEIQQDDLAGDRMVFRSTKWTLLNSTAGRLSWDQKKLSEIGVNSIDASVTPIYVHGPTIEDKADVKTGNIIFYGLMQTTDYQLNLKALRTGRTALYNTIHFTTGSAEDDKITTTTGTTEGKEGGASSGGFALSSTISAALLACMTMVLA
ncbi:hypothetical protein ECG_08405 [Echinococcus granulosus]|uniref:EG95 n=1 Tax=Echinococcus granulosus TaxID=6210 RepID=W6U1W6_ECHGR|nr:hypothetical protein EGR_10626 [Echinococcus granulosus]EUB54516.1 hypothetical protein EGR_10626 [Echinococcus granulosus]KAH9278808.1 hypothetical protein ECG_08406 [Echinococcus granulosus]KAH9278809.1 hypothetical protein ECG_08405 [Echinococcus granulosus]